MRSRRGFTLTEALVASSISIGAIAVTTWIYFSNMGSWAKGRGDIDSMATTQVAVKKVAMELQEAISVSVSADGLRIDYQLPSKAGDGSYTTPAVSDNVARAFAVTGGKLIQYQGGSSRVITSNMILTNPINNQAFVPFQGDGSVVTRMVQVTLASEKEGQSNKKQSSCVTETIYLRNIPKKKS